MTNTKKKAEEQLQQVISRYGGKEKFNEFLKSMGSDEDAYYELLCKNYCINQFFLSDNEEYKEATNVTEEEVYNYILEKYGEDGPISSVNIKHILISTQNDDLKPLSKEEKQEKKDLADDLYDQIMKGADMDSLIMEYSSEKEEYEGNPDGIYLRPSDVRDEVLSVILSLEENQVCKPFETEYGYYIIKLIKKNFTYLEEVKEGIEGQIRNEKEIQLGIKWMADYKIVKNEDTYNSL